MSIKTTIRCDICKESFSRTRMKGSAKIEEGLNERCFYGEGFSVTFRSIKNRDLTLGRLHETSGTHICQPCAQALFEELTKMKAEKYIK